MSSEVDSILTIFDFNYKSESNSWLSVDDNVMGGLSEGNASFSENDGLVFSGTISLENNGGFSSIRTNMTDKDLSAYTGLKIRIKGDGRKYQFRLRTGRSFDGIAYQQDFQTSANTWIEIDLPFEYFLPTFRGRILENVTPLSAKEIKQMGFLIADKKAGPFKLIVGKIMVYK